MVENNSEAPLTTGQKFAYAGTYLLFGLIALLPLSWARALGASAGSLYYRFANKRVHITRINLEICFPELSDSDREKLVHDTFKSAGMWVLEGGAIWMWSTQRILRYVEVENESIFLNALAQGKGVMFSMPHHGNWEVLGPYTTCHSQFSCFYQHEGTAQVFNEFVRRRRSRNGTLMAPANAIGVRRLYKHLRAGNVAGLLPDHFPSDNMGVFAPFFKRPAFTGTVISSLVEKNNTALLTVACLRTKKGFKIHFIEVDQTPTNNSIAAATALNASIEQAIRLAPEQFQWFYPRFRRRENPELDPNPYR